MLVSGEGIQKGQKIQGQLIAFEGLGILLSLRDILSVSEFRTVK
jgi:hypothetical protein